MTAFKLWCPRSHNSTIFGRLPLSLSPFSSVILLHSRPLLLFLFYKQIYRIKECSIKVADVDDWIRSQVLWYPKQPCCQLCHNRRQTSSTFFLFTNSSVCMPILLEALCMLFSSQGGISLSSKRPM